MKRTLVITGFIVGILLLVVAIWYWITPAGSLPMFFPGYAAGSSVIHTKHAIAAFVLGLLALLFAWFQSGPKRI